MYTLVNPSLAIQKWGVRGSTLHGHVSMMCWGVCHGAASLLLKFFQAHKLVQHSKLYVNWMKTEWLYIFLQ